MVDRERNHPSCGRWNCCQFSARFNRKDKELARINAIWISDFVPVRFVNDGVSQACTVGEAGDPVRSAYGANYRRLQEVTTKYDSKNFFRMNQNIRPLA